MKRILVGILTLAMILSFVGCGSGGKPEIAVPPAAKLYEQSGLLCVQNKDGKWVFIDETGKTVVETNYTTLLDSAKETFSNAGVGVLRNNDTWAVMDTNGKELAVFKNQNNVEYNIFGFGEKKVSLITKKISRGQEVEFFAYGVIDNTGKMVADFVYKSIHGFSKDGYAVFENTDGKFGLMDTTGAVVLAATYDDEDDVPSFSKNGLAPKKETDKNGFSSWGYINVKGEWVIQPQFNTAAKFQSNGLAEVKTADGYGIIDESGKILTSQSFESISDYKHGVAITFSDKTYGLINEEGKILASGYEKIEIATSQFAEVRLDGKKGYIMLDGKEYLKCNFEDIGSVGANGLVAAKSDKKWGYVDKTGKWVIDAVFSSASTFGSNGYAVVALDGKYGLINDKGEYAVEPQYKKIFNYNTNGIAAVKVNRSWEFLNQEGQKVGSIPTESLWCYPGDGCFITCDSSMVYSIIKDGKAIASGLKEIAYNPNANR